jgi:hypothetical protein
MGTLQATIHTAWTLRLGTNIAIIAIAAGPGAVLLRGVSGRSRIRSEHRQAFHSGSDMLLVTGGVDPDLVGVDGAIIVIAGHEAGAARAEIGSWYTGQIHGVDVSSGVWWQGTGRGGL